MVAGMTPVPKPLASDGKRTRIGYREWFLHWRARRKLRSLGWQEQARDWRDRGYEMSDRLQAAAPDVAKVAGDAGKYVSQAMSENSISGLLIAAAVGGVLGYLLHSRS
jgi:hypothetical protein